MWHCRGRLRILSLALSLCSTVFHSTKADPLRDFQVTQPPPFPPNAKRCTLPLFEHTFGNSFGLPAVASFVPPTTCGQVGSWAGVTLNLTATSVGRQFDRLAIVSFNGNEIWRSSTPEPTGGDGIIWTYVKDVTRYIPLFLEPGVFQLELDNLLSQELGLDGQYNVQFSVTFIASSVHLPPAKTADLIVPLTNITSVPPQFSTNASFPQNLVEAYAEVIASGNGNEEFWYNNAANSFFNDIPPGNTFPDGPFREIRLFVDSHLAGVVFPYPVYFTGADTPPAWRPITSYGALDQPTYTIDLTAFVPLLADGKGHNITLDVVSIEANHTINQNWFVSGLIHVFTGSSSKRSTGTITLISAPPFAVGEVIGSVGPNGDVNITVTASRTIHIEANVIAGDGKNNHVVWKQQLQYSNTQNYLNNATIQNVKQISQGESTSLHDGLPAVRDSFQYPMEIDLTATSDFVNFSAVFNHSYLRNFIPGPFTFGSTITNVQVAKGTFSTITHSGIGSNSNEFTYVDTEGNSFNRQVSAINNSITLDQSSGSLLGSLPLLTALSEGTDALSVCVGKLPGGRGFPG